MDDGITAREAAERLGTTVQTVRSMARDGSLAANRAGRAWRVDPASVADFLAADGPLGGGRRHRSSEARLRAEVEGLRGQLVEITAADGVDVAALLRERDELRERVAVLEDAVARLRDVAELQRQVEDERAQVVEQLTAAVASAERAEKLRRKSVQLLEDGLASSVVPARRPTSRR